VSTKNLFRFILNVVRNPKVMAILDHTDFIQVFSSEGDETIGVYVGFVRYRKPSVSESQFKIAITQFITELSNVFPEGMLTYQNETPVFSVLINRELLEEVKSVGRKTE